MTSMHRSNILARLLQPLLIIASVMAASLTASIALSEESAPAESEARPKPDFIADGARVNVEDKGFSIVPPQGWEVFLRRSNLSLLMQVPFEPGLKYQRTIQVATFAGSRYIDEVTAKEYEEIIVRKFSETAVAVVDYRIRNHMNVDAADGRPALLFYSEFSIDNVDLMQAHVLVSSATHHYLLTYTDLASHFEDEQANQYLTEAWNSIISVQLSSSSPARFDGVKTFAYSMAIFVVLLVGIWGFRTWTAGRQYKKYANGQEAEYGENVSDDSKVTNLASKRQKKASEASKHSSHADSSEYNADLDDDQASGDAFSDVKVLDDDEDLAS